MLKKMLKKMLKMGAKKSANLYSCLDSQSITICMSDNDWVENVPCMESILAAEVNTKSINQANPTPEDLQITIRNTYF